MDWFRWFHGAVSDDKWPLVARKSGQPVAAVVAVWAALLECASQAENRGCIEDFDPESVDALLQLEDGATEAILDVLKGGKKPRIIDGRIANWEKRQPLRERQDTASAKRVQEYRDRQKKLGHEQCNANVTPVKHHETPRLDKRREEENSNTPLKAPPVETRQPASGPEPVREGRGEGPVAMPHGGKDSLPGIEFTELRELYDREGVPEAPMSGHVEFLALCRQKQWPGLGRITQAIHAFSQSDGKWQRGYRPNLSRFLREHWWLKKPDDARARDPAGGFKSAAEKRSENVSAIIAMVGRAKEMQEHGDTGEDRGCSGAFGPELQPSIDAG